MELANFKPPRDSFETASECNALEASGGFEVPKAAVPPAAGTVIHVPACRGRRAVAGVWREMPLVNDR